MTVRIAAATAVVVATTGLLGATSKGLDTLDKDLVSLTVVVHDTKGLVDAIEEG